MFGLCIMGRLVCANVLVVIDISSLTYQHREVPALAGARFFASRAPLGRSVKCIGLLFHVWSPESVKMAMCASLRCVSANFSAALPLLSRPAHIWTCQNSLRPNILRTLYTSSRLSGGKNFTELTVPPVLYLTFSLATEAMPVFKSLTSKVWLSTEFVLRFKRWYFGGSFVTSRSRFVHL